MPVLLRVMAQVWIIQPADNPYRLSVLIYVSLELRNRVCFGSSLTDCGLHGFSFEYFVLDYHGCGHYGDTCDGP